MSRKKAMWAALAIIVLAGLNLFRWAPSPADVASRARAQAPEASDLKLRVDATAMAPTSLRDPFNPKVVVVPKPIVKKVEAPPPPPGPPPKTPEELEAEAARAELTTIKLVGVVFKEGKAQAFLVKGDQVFLVFAGDKVANRFTVESITADSAMLVDNKTAVSGRLSISGS